MGPEYQHRRAFALLRWPDEVTRMSPTTDRYDEQLAEEFGPEHQHGDGPVERHSRATAVLRRRV